MALYHFCQIFINCSEMLYEVCAIFIVSFFILYAFMSHICSMLRLAIYAIIMFWSASCLILVLSLTIRRVGVTGGIRIVFRYAGVVPGYKNSFRYIQYLLDLRGRRQVVTDLFVRLIYKFCAILPARLWSRSFDNTWAMELDWVFSLYSRL